MATIQVVVDDELLCSLDEELQGRHRTRSAFIRQAIEEKLRRAKRARLDELDRLAYLEPQSDEERKEAEAWSKVASWGERWEPKSR